jgi:RimJ/RimL family protein N-acetyltransferase
MIKNMPERLEAGSVYLVPFNTTRVFEFTQWWNDSEIQYFNECDCGIIFNEEGQAAFLKEMDASNDEAEFHIYDKLTNALIGYAGLTDIDLYCRNAEIGINICDKDFRHKKLGYEIIELIVQFAFGSLGLHTLFCRIFSFNTASEKLFMNSGFSKCGTLHEAVIRDDKYYDFLFYELINKASKQRCGGHEPI